MKTVFDVYDLQPGDKCQIKKGDYVIVIRKDGTTIAAKEVRE